MLRKSFVICITMLFCIQAFSMYSEPTKINFPEYSSEDLRTRPAVQEDREFWYTLHQSSSVCSQFRDGKTREPGQVDFQFSRSILRSENNDPRYLHIIEQLIGDEWRPIGTVVLGGSVEPNFLECAIITHPAFDIDKNTYMEFDSDGKTIQSLEQLHATAQDDIKPIWGNKNASKILEWGLKEYIPYIQKYQINYSWVDEKGGQHSEQFNGSQYSGILATATNPASIAILGKYGFKKQAQEECQWGKKHHYKFLFK